MNTDLLASALTHIVLLPPFCLILGALLGMLVARWKPRAGRALTLASLAALVALSTTAGARLLMQPLERLAIPLDPSGIHGAGAIVILAAGRVEQAPEYGGKDIPDRIALARLRYGAHLQHRTGLPILVSGGVPPGALLEPNARMLARTLRDDFRTPVAWLEEASTTTAENAAFSARILKDNKVRRIVLVTDALHMARAERVFARTGLEVIAAPTMFHSTGPLRAAHFVPSVLAIQNSYYASYELVGMAWYRLREALGRN